MTQITSNGRAVSRITGPRGKLDAITAAVRLVEAWRVLGYSARTYIFGEWRVMSTGSIVQSPPEGWEVTRYDAGGFCVQWDKLIKRGTGKIERVGSKSGFRPYEIRVEVDFKCDAIRDAIYEHDSPLSGNRGVGGGGYSGGGECERDSQ